MPRRPMSLGEALGGAVSRSGDRYQDYTIRKQATDRQGGLDSLNAAFQQSRLEQGDRQIRGAEDRAALDREQFGHRQHMDFANLLAQSLEANRPEKPSTTSPVNSTEAAIARKWMSGEITEEQAVEMMKRFSMVEGRGKAGGGTSSTVSPSGLPISSLNKMGEMGAESFLEGRKQLTDPAQPWSPMVQPPMSGLAPDSLNQAFLRPFQQYGGYNLNQQGQGEQGGPPPPPNDGSFSDVEYEDFKRQWYAKQLWKQ